MALVVALRNANVDMTLYTKGASPHAEQTESNL
jgi:hypothetical protein